MKERRYRNGPSHPIPVWNGILGHRQRINSACWVFLWLLDAITEENNGVGIVRGGAPVKASKIAKDLAFDRWTVRHHLQALERGGYIKRRRTPYGFAIEVCNSRKFGIWNWHKRAGENPHSEGERTGVLHRESVGFTTQRVGENLRYKEDAAKNAAKNAAAKPPLAASPKSEDSVWGFLGISPCGPPSFRSLLESGWASRNGQRPTALIGETVDAWEDAEREKLRAPRLFRALSELRDVEKKTATTSNSNEPIHAFAAEEIPA